MSELESLITIGRLLGEISDHLAAIRFCAIFMACSTLGTFGVLLWWHLEGKR